MRGHLRKRGKSSWAIVLDHGRDSNGRRRQKWHSVKGTKRDAEAELARLLNELRTGEYVEPPRLFLSEYLDKWLRDSAKPRVADKTFERYNQIVECAIKPALGHISLSKLRPLDIQRFYATALAGGRKNGSGGLSPRTVLHYHRVLSAALKQAVRWQLLLRNPAAYADPPRPERQRMRALDEDETINLLKLTADKNLHIPVLLAVTAGLRRGEILALQWKNVDLETGDATIECSLEQTTGGLKIKSPKTERSRRTVVLPAFSCDALKAHWREQAEKRLLLGPAYQDQGLICCREDGTPWPPDAFSTTFASFVRRSDIAHFRFHDLRHTHATQLLKQGVHSKIVSERLGHSNIGITLDTYSHVLPGMQAEAMASFDLFLNRAMSHRS